MRVPSAFRVAMENRFHGRLGSPCRRLKVRGRYSRQSRSSCGSPRGSGSGHHFAVERRLWQPAEKCGVPGGNLFVRMGDEGQQIVRIQLVTVVKNAAAHHVEQVLL